MIFEDEPKPKPREGFQPARLEGWSEADLRAYIAELTAEIARSEAAIAARAHQRAAADAFFRKPGG
ncbi:DUF1192 family protein [Sediminicoccus sp. KRV36]|uniref:DUF1192 family protein n=1 Tax=Sediminicoccus sp. KRV36 TaxID=3133721 RepID=UPI00200FF020|nr:DUF1192 family protein [Sediminicoccus rosea]UPY36496.1 DUF1192 domain-containing protein [Sediminicoccus rosea]